jgi:hypothetical protein
MVGYEVSLDYPDTAVVGRAYPISATITCPTGCVRGRLVVSLDGNMIIQLDTPNIGFDNDYSETVPAGYADRYTPRSSDAFSLVDGEVVFNEPGEYALGWRVGRNGRQDQDGERFTISVSEAPAPSFSTSCSTPDATQQPDTPISVPVTVSNSGGAGTASVSLLVDGDPTATTTTTVDAYSEKTVTFEIELPGDPSRQRVYSIDANADPA